MIKFPYSIVEPRPHESSGLLPQVLYVEDLGCHSLFFWKLLLGDRRTKIVYALTIYFSRDVGTLKPPY